MLTAWQDHGRELEAVRAEFGVDAERVRDLLLLWQRRGPEIAGFLQTCGEAHVPRPATPSRANGAPYGAQSKIFALSEM